MMSDDQKMSVIRVIDTELKQGLRRIEFDIALHRPNGLYVPVKEFIIATEGETCDDFATKLERLAAVIRKMR